MTFDETSVVRDRGGRFDRKLTEPELTLDAPAPARTPGDVFADALDGRQMEIVEPRGLTQTRRALRNARGEEDGSIRSVVISRASVPASTDAGAIEVVGPKDGRPLIVEVQSGFHDLGVTSGHVIILASSVSGHPITVKGGAHVELIARPGVKVSVTAEPGSTVDFHGGEGVRGYQRVEPGATFNVFGNSSHLTISRVEEQTIARDAETRSYA